MRTDIRARPLEAACLTVVLMLGVWLSGCDSGGGGPAAPSALEVRLSAPSVQVTRTVTATAVALDRRDALEVTWLVDGAIGGSDSTGTITQDNPATYTAPEAVPDGGSVIIEARLGSQASATDTLDVLFTIIHVDAEAGDDGAGAGTWAAPLRTVSAGLPHAEAGDTVFVHPGTYDPAHGESPPYDVPEGVTLRGADSDSCTLVGDGDEGNVVELEDGACVERFTIGNADRDAIAVNMSHAGSIRRIVVTDPFLFAVFRSMGDSNALIEDCRLENTRRPQTGRGMELISGSHATVRRCTLRGWFQGAFMNGDSDPLIEYSVFEDNVLGLDTFETNDEYTEPDLGGGPRGSLGANVIRGNSSCGLANRTPGTIYAINNTWNVEPLDPPIVCYDVGDSCDICITNTGVVFWCPCAPE